MALITAAPIAVFTRLEVDEKRGDGLPLCEEVSHGLLLFFGVRALFSELHWLTCHSLRNKLTISLAHEGNEVTAQSFP